MQLPEFVRSKASFSMYEKNVTLETFRFPLKEGGVAEDDFLLFGANGQPVVVFPITHEGKLVVLKHYRYATRNIVWEFPGGTEHDASDEDAAIEELIAETGYKAEEIKAINSTRRIWFDPASCKVGFRPMIATGCECVGSPERNPDEFFEPREIEIHEWIRMIFTGEVVDSKSITMTLLALPMLSPDMRVKALTQLSD